MTIKEKLRLIAQMEKDNRRRLVKAGLIRKRKAA